MSNFDEALVYVLGGEGDFVDDQEDAGGTTKYGISFSFLKRLPMDRLKLYGISYVDDDHLKQIIKDIDIKTAKTVYKGEFWDNTPIHKVNSQNVANIYLDCAVMSGIADATKFLQRAVCAYLGEYNLLIDDGVCGQKTLDKINFYGNLLIPPLRSERASHYRQIVLRKTSQEKFLKGWLRRAYK